MSHSALDHGQVDRSPDDSKFEIWISPYAPRGCECDYVIQSGDWLSKIADQLYGDYSLYPAIMLATNARSTLDSSFATIADPRRQCSFIDYMNVSIL